MNKRPNPKVSREMFIAIRKDALLGVSRETLSRRYKISRDTLRRVVHASGWNEWTAKLEQKRLRYHEKKMQAAAESCPDKAADIEVIQNPDAPAVQPEQVSIMDELHEYRPGPLERVEVGGLPKQICERIHALSKYPVAVEIIGKAVVLCPEAIGSVVNSLYFPLFGMEMT